MKEAVASLAAAAAVALARCDKEVGIEGGRKAEVNLIVVRHAKRQRGGGGRRFRCYRPTFEKWKGGRWEDYYTPEY